MARSTDVSVEDFAKNIRGVREIQKISGEAIAYADVDLKALGYLVADAEIQDDYAKVIMSTYNSAKLTETILSGSPEIAQAAVNKLENAGLAVPLILQTQAKKTKK